MILLDKSSFSESVSVFASLNLSPTALESANAHSSLKVLSGIGLSAKPGYATGTSPF